MAAHRNVPNNRNVPKSKRGIVLLLVISLLALFVLIGVTYALVAARYLDAAKTQTLQQQTGDLPEKEIDIVLAQILYDTAARSSLRGHSLLGDLYGSDSVYVSNQPPNDNDTKINNVGGGVWGNQAFMFDVLPSTLQSFGGRLSPISEYYTGRLLTFTEGPASGYSGRILEYKYDPTNIGPNPRFVIELDYSSNHSFGTPVSGNHFVINGAPFNGAGAGYDTTTHNLDATYTIGGIAHPAALQPHYAGYDPNGMYSAPNVIDAGGLDESWDAVDFQNMFMAMVPPRAAESLSDGNPANDLPIVPSYHRPELVNYWLNHLNSVLAGSPDPVNNSQHRDFLRSIIFRPMPWDHPNFTGSNLAFAGAANALTNAASSQGTWDVDNDSDGIPDSIWIDPGLPLITTPDGKRVKRLVAIMVKDLDGRVNINAHGNGMQTVGAFQSGNPVTLGLAMGATLPRGMGFGPAEVDFSNLFGTYYASVLQSRYLDGAPGVAGVRDPLSRVKFHGVPNDYQSYAGWYASPPDVWGRGAVALDYGGQPITVGMGQFNEMLDSPYELSLSGTYTNSDAPYKLFELERLLRFHDSNARNIAFTSQLDLASGSLLTSGMSGTINAYEAIRQSVTTIGSSLPVPGTQPPPYLRRSVGVHSGISDMYSARIREQLLYPPYPMPLTLGQANDLNHHLTNIVPWEIRQGGKFNINRWLGDGYDMATALAPSGDFVPDDPLESFSGELAWSNTNTPARAGPIPLAPAPFAGTSAEHVNGLDANQDGVTNAVDRSMARQLYARHLFSLAALLIDPSFMPRSQNETIAAPLDQQLYIRRLAQWAINCVDFRDADSIMTPFEYDANPFNGWQVDGVLTTDGSAMNPERIYNPNTLTVEDVQTNERGLVWGTEYPDLLITETLAFHDRRVKDTAHDDNTQKKRDETTQAERDNDVDQLRVPQGSLFVELYSPRNSYVRNPALPRELYDYSSGSPNLALGKVSPNGWPVWRLAVTPILEDAGTTRPTHPNSMATAHPESASFDAFPMSANLLPAIPPGGVLPLERYVWFTSPANAFGVTGSALANYSYYSNSNANPQLPPGRYAIVAPRATTYLGSEVTGSLWSANSPQSMILNGAGITITDASGVTSTLTPGTDISPAVPIVADMSGVTPMGWTDPAPWNIGLNISEPLPSGNYYPQPPDLTAAQPDFYDDPTTPQNTLPDVPQDSDDPAMSGIAAGRPLFEHSMCPTGTYPNCAAVFLQRLANPNLPYDPVQNPYLSMDWASIDLTVFSGEEDTNQNIPGMNGGPIDHADAPANRTEPVRFRTRQRGHLISNSPTGNFWPPATNIPAPTAAVAAGTPNFYFRHSLDSDKHTFPYVNSTVSTPYPPTGEPAPNPDCPPWLTWNNRPFTNPMELLLVPSSSPSRICSEITPGFQLSLATNVYDGGPGNEWNLRAPFGHLLNFFHSDNNGADSPNLSRLLDYVEVPSPYAGAERWFNPSNFGAAGLYRPPFNKMSRFRDPGRININTIFDEQIWIAATGQFPGMNTIDFANAIFLSRQAYGSVASGTPFDYATSAAYPTRFANPFRPADTSDLMPAGPMRRTNPVEATLLRPLPDPTDGTQFAGGANNKVPLLNRNLTNVWDNTDRNPYFRYQAMQKLGNVFTTHSNCYAVWITMGYFEAEVDQPNDGIDNDSDMLTDEPGEIEPSNPDGYALGQEIGFDTGEVTRHRAFFLIDRSVPVGFIPGQKLNAMDCVLLRRFIE